MKKMVSLFTVTAALAFANSAWAVPLYFCASQSNRTWLIVNEGEFKIVQDGTVLRHGVVTNASCAESWPASCTLSSADGPIADITVGDTAQGTISYVKEGVEYETPVVCSIHPYSTVN